MGRFGWLFIRTVPGLLGSALMFLSSIPLKDARTTLTGNLESLGIDVPAILQTVTANRLIFSLGLCLFLMAGWLVFRGKRASVDYNDVDQWSVDVEPGRSWVWAIVGGEPVKTIQNQGWRFYNKSTTQTRIIDVEIEVRTELPELPALLLRTSDTHSDGEAPTRPRHRMIGRLPQPVIIGPNDKAEGQIEFEVHSATAAKLMGSGVVVPLFDQRITIIERRANMRRILLPEQCYDARQRRAYYGRLGLPDSRWERLRRWGRTWKYRLCGRPSRLPPTPRVEHTPAALEEKEPTP